MVEMKDVGEKSRELDAPEVDKDRVHYPTLFLSTKQLPKLKDMKPGEKLTLLVDAEVKGFTLKSTEDKKEEGNYDIEVQKIGISKKSAQESEDEEGEESENKKLRGEAKERFQR